jgi:MinD-like ATPase involved in chromosome partitioning or flagellar assembly
VNTKPIVLMMTESPASFDGLRRALESCQSPHQLLRVGNVAMALARVAGGGVKSIVADCSGSSASNESLIELRNGVWGLPVMLWSDTVETTGPARVIESGACGWLTPNASASELKRLFPGEAPPEKRAAVRPRTESVVIAVMGAKGGVGTTTVAMNIAAGLAATGNVILAEIRSTFGSLQGHFHPGRLVRSAVSLVEGASVKSVLWPVPRVAGLRVLFGPQTATECRELDAARTMQVLDQLDGESPFIVVDLPVSLGAENRAILGASQHLALVVEPTSACLRLGRLTIDAIQSWEQPPTSIGAVVVRRRSEDPVRSMRELESELSIPILRVIPPAPELCVVGEQAHVPMIACDPENLAAEGLMALARRFDSRGVARAGR